MFDEAKQPPQGGTPPAPAPGGGDQGAPQPPAGGGGAQGAGAQPTSGNQQQGAAQPPASGAGAQPPAQKKDDAPAPPADPNARTGQLKRQKGHIFVIPPHPNTTFDEAYFLDLLEGSISLTMEEKQRVIDAIPRLKIEQINELITIFEEEKQKFAELEKEFAGDVAKLKAEREKEMEVTQVKKEEESEAEEDAAAAEELKKQMGLGEES